MKLLKLPLFLLLAIAFVFTSCDDDDSTVPDVAVVPDEEPDSDPVSLQVAINEISFQGTDWVEIVNLGDGVADISDFWLCLGPGTYQQISALDVLAGETTIPVGGFLVVGYGLPDTDGGLGLYNSNSNFGDATTIVDFVQYGAGASARENVAVEAGIWTAGEFVTATVSETNSIAYDGEGNAASDWAETTTPTVGEVNQVTPPAEATNIQVAINEVSFQGTDWVEIANQGDGVADISDYWLCLGPGTYQQIGNLTVLAGETTIPVGGFLVVGYGLPDTDGGLGLYNSNSNFGDATTIVDFVQYGSGGSSRENVAVEAGIWSAGDFVIPGRLSSYSIAYDGEGDSSSDWAEAINPTVGLANDTPIETTTFNVTITNRINYVGAVLYNEPQNTSSTRSNPDRASLDSPGEFFDIDFVASPGANMSFVSMSSISNDWLFAPRGEGIQIFNDNGDPILGDITDQILLWDAGTEEENPDTFGGAGTDLRQDDDDNTVRVQETDVSEYLNAELTNYDASTRTFTLRITNLRGEFADPDPIRISPGIVTLHAQDNPFFTEGEPDRGVGLQLIAERGNINDLWDWLNETGTDNAPLRLSSSWSTISPGLIYAFNTDVDPWFTQGEAMVAGSGIEDLAEAGNPMVAWEFINGLGLPVSVSEETTNLVPGESLTFTIEVPQGQNYKLGIGTMLTRTNDWFMSFNNNGVPLWDENGVILSGTSESDEIYLFDAGTEEDEFVGIGSFLGTPPGPEDDNTIIRRVMAIDDQQFGKGIIESAAGTAWLGDPRGGYNLLEVDVQPQ